MMGQALFSTDIPVTKNSSALTVLSEDAVAKEAQTACIRCGKCADVCPGHIIPQVLMSYASVGDFEGFEKANGMECCECGCCSFVCPAKRHLTQQIKGMRKIQLGKRAAAAAKTWSESAKFGMGHSSLTGSVGGITPDNPAEIRRPSC